MQSVPLLPSCGSCVPGSPGWCQHRIGRHLRQEWDDGSPEVLVPVPPTHLGHIVVPRGHLNSRVIIEPKRERTGIVYTVLYACMSHVLLYQASQYICMYICRSILQPTQPLAYPYLYLTTFSLPLPYSQFLLHFLPHNKTAVVPRPPSQLYIVLHFFLRRGEIVGVEPGNEAKDKVWCFDWKLELVERCSLLVSNEGLSGLLCIALPLPVDMSGNWVSGVQSDGLPWVVT